jgi:ribosomal protein S18 acetylase RimI-like enzyme
VPAGFESEAALEACLPFFTRLPGASLIEQRDLRLIVSRHRDAAFNHIVATRLEPDRVMTRVAEVEQLMGASASLPATWWVYSPTRPPDLAARLESAGLRREEPEFGMIIDLAVPLPPVDIPAGVSITELSPADDLGTWLDVMAASYGWTNPAKAATMAELYRLQADETPPWTHLLAHRGGLGVASASLFTIDDHAFVTNVGTIPETRGLGLGSAVTTAALSIARRAGFARASLTASVMGRAMYTRLGFREETRLDRLTLGVAA